MYQTFTNYYGRTKVLLSKIMLLMRLTTLILIAGMMQVSASTFGQKITLTKKNVSLESVLKEIRKQSGYDFFYDGKILPKSEHINVSFKQTNIDDALNILLKDLSLTYSIDGKIISIKRSAEKKRGIERIIVKGIVVDEYGKPLIGAKIFVDDTNIATASNEMGEFVIRDVEAGATIFIAYIGYQATERKARPDLGTIQMMPAVQNLDEVTVEYNTGYQKISRERVAGSFAKPNMKTMMNRTTSPNVLSRLEGLIPGLSSGSGGQSGGMVIRGSTSINVATKPLVVVDGVEVQSIEQVNMQDVDDITVLKDATSASIWGAKAANGVIVITTKKGKANSELKIDYDGYYAFNGRPKRDYLPVWNSRDFIASEKEIFPLEAAGTTYAAASANRLEPHRQILWDQHRGVLSAAQAQTKLDSLANIDNWKQVDQLFYRNAAQYNQTISASGGSEVHSFYGSLNHIGTISNTPGDREDQYKINFRNDLKLGKRVNLYVNTDLTNLISRSIGSGGNTAPRYQLYQDAIGQPLITNYISPYGEDGLMPSEENRIIQQRRSRINLDYSPVQEFNTRRFRGNQLAARIVGGGTVNILNGLTFTGTYGYNVASRNERTVLDESSWIVRRDLVRFTVAPDDDATPVYYLPQSGGRLNTANAIDKSWTVRNQMNYTREWDKNWFNIMAGQEATHRQIVDNTSVYYGWDDQLQISRPVDFATLAQGINGVAGPSGPLAPNLGGGEGRVARTTSYFATAGYTYASNYTLNASWRIDQSNLFGLDKSAQNRPVYSVGAKWSLGRETFMQDFKKVDALDLRFSYGITGNAPNVGEAASFDILISETDPNAVTGGGLILSVPANNRLTWERTQVYNAGLDFAFFGNRLNGSIDAYIKNTSGLIGNLFTSPFNGYSSVIGNFGDMQNKGIDLSISSINLRMEDFQWSTNLVLGYNRNKLIKLNLNPPVTGEEMVGQPGVSIMEGRPLNLLFSYNYAGLDASGNPLARRADGTLTSAPNEIMSQDMVYSGLTQAPWNGGLTNTFQYRNFSLAINMVYSLGYKMRDPLNGLSSLNPEFNDRWKQVGDESRTDIPKYVFLASENAERQTEYYRYANTRVLDASYVKIRDISLGYTVPEMWARRIRAKNIAFRCNVSNLLVWTANSHFYDPENEGNRIRPAQGTISLGAHLTF